MDNADIVRAFATFSGQLSGIASDTRTMAGNVSEMRSELREMNGRVGRLEKEVFGSDPPPMAKPVTPLLARTSEAEADVDAVQGRLIAVEARLAKVETLNEKQSSVMGIATPNEQGEEPGYGMRAITFVKSRAGRDLLFQLALIVLAAMGYKAASSVEAKVDHAPPAIVVHPTAPQ